MYSFRHTAICAQDDWIQTAAQAEHIPVYSLKTAGRAALARGIRVVLGIDSSPGAVFGGCTARAKLSRVKSSRPSERSRTLAGFVSQVFKSQFESFLLWQSQ